MAPCGLGDVLRVPAYILQGRNWMPDPVGGVAWFGFAQPSETVYMPFYAGVTSVPEEFSNTNRSVFDHNSAYWAFNFVTNWATINYNLISRDIRAQQQQIEQKELGSQPAVEKKALAILVSDGNDAAKKYLTQYSPTNADNTVNAWWQFSDSLVVKYSNQMVTNVTDGSSQNPGLPDWWLNETRYQYGPRVYDYEGLQQVPGLVYTNQTVYTTPGNETCLHYRDPAATGHWRATADGRL